MKHSARSYRSYSAAPSMSGSVHSFGAVSHRSKALVPWTPHMAPGAPPPHPPIIVMVPAGMPPPRMLFMDNDENALAASPFAHKQQAYAVPLNAMGQPAFAYQPQFGGGRMPVDARSPYSKGHIVSRADAMHMQRAAYSPAGGAPFGHHAHGGRPGQPLAIMPPAMQHQRHHSMPYPPTDAMPMGREYDVGAREVSGDLSSPGSPSPRPFVTSPEGAVIYGTLPHHYRAASERPPPPVHNDKRDKRGKRKGAGGRPRRPELRDSLYNVNEAADGPAKAAGAAYGEFYDRASMMGAPVPGYAPGPWPRVDGQTAPAMANGVGDTATAGGGADPHQHMTQMLIDRKVRHAFDEHRAQAILR